MLNWTESNFLNGIWIEVYLRQIAHFIKSYEEICQWEDLLILKHFNRGTVCLCYTQKIVHNSDIDLSDLNSSLGY